MAKVSSVPPLLAAASKADAAIVQLLLDRRADPSATDADGTSALMLACHHGLMPAVQALLQARRPPRLCVRQAGVQTSRALRETGVLVQHALTRLLWPLQPQAGAAVDATSKSGETALSIARKRGHAAACSLLAA